MSGRSGEIVADTVLMPASAPLVEVVDIWKSFGEVAALRGASMWANRGELTAIVGDNGAGKSTLIKCISGIYAPDRGSIRIAGTAVAYRGPEEARHHGIETVYQDLALVDDLAVYQNVFLDREPTWGFGPVRFLARRAMEERTRALFGELNVSVPSVSGKVRGSRAGSVRRSPSPAVSCGVASWSSWTSRRLRWVSGRQPRSRPSSETS
jgi:ABC-type sugar transport system ATPase subunit